MSCNNKQTVLVTGFGAFGKHVINASWEAVKELTKLCAESKELRDVQIIAEEIPVSYDYVSAQVIELWKKHNPVIVIHVGVSHKADCLTIEYCARNSGYIRPDICDKCPDETYIDCDYLETGIDVEALCDNVNKNSSTNGCRACISYDAGRYLCEYIYYQSLRIKKHRTLFVHVPDFDKYTSVQVANGLYNIIHYLLRSLKDNE